MTVIWRLKISFPSVYIINDHVLTVNKQYKQTEVPLDFSEQGLCGRINFLPQYFPFQLHLSA